MGKFWGGFVTAVLVLAVGGFAYARLGFVNPRADIPVNSLDKAIAMPALDESIDKRAPKLENPVQATDANLAAGMQMYQKHCSNCHGDPVHEEATLSKALYPRPPQFMHKAPDMPEYQNFYILEHGIRYSGMPAWTQTYDKQQLWQITAFLRHMDKLPPVVTAHWDSLASKPGS